ncbi:GNAT family N-acetyltransferase [Paraglaciecola marina]|uniref:GNAT family N-acetyltransferase n=1 Tax=Paraglaciecola marina TaxID=2500157 RepID=UPI00105DB318|nr:GNAT family N-acetyltransferase [Paraglaciecola marina]
MLSDIKIKYYQPDDLVEIQEKWSALFKISSASPFHNIYWINSWLSSLPKIPHLIEAREAGNIVGLALFCEKQERTVIGTKLKQLWLHRFGQQDYDQVWIEHNDFLLADKNKDIIRKAMLMFLKENKGLWDELYLGMATENTVNKFTEVLGFKRVDICSPDFVVNLINTKDSDDYLKDLSKNTRSQINRSLKLLSQQGSIELKQAMTRTEKNLFLKEISKIHIQKWGNTQFGSGFSNPIFTKFHSDNLHADIEGEHCRLYSLNLDNKPLAYVYIIKNTDKWYFYLSAIKNNRDNKVKIGLVIHTLLINEAINNGANCYSFLAGEARYKRSMSNTPVSLQELVCFYRPTALPLCKEKLRAIKRQILSLYSDFIKSSK